MTSDAPVVIVGGGLMGAASAWALSRRGVPVTLFEQFHPGHGQGSSHGSARIVRRAYGDPLYVSLAARAFEMWDELESVSGASILRMLGGLDFGAGRDTDAVARFLHESGVEHEFMPAAEAELRWPGMRFEGSVVYHPQAGTMDAAAAVTAMLAQASAFGATVRQDTVVADVPGDGSVLLADGDRVQGRCVVVAAGGWLAPLLRDTVALPPLEVVEKTVWHFARAEPSTPAWPSVIHVGEREVYHLAGGFDDGIDDDRKIGEHYGGRPVTAGEPGFIDLEPQPRFVDYVRRWLPGLDPTPRQPVNCLYTMTPSEDFLLDRQGDVVVCSPCSGHGAKFAPLIGELVADLVTDAAAATVPEQFRLLTHAAGRRTAVSL